MFILTVDKRPKEVCTKRNSSVYTCIYIQTHIYTRDSLKKKTYIHNVVRLYHTCVHYSFCTHTMYLQWHSRAPLVLWLASRDRVAS